MTRNDNLHPAWDVPDRIPIIIPSYRPDEKLIGLLEALRSGTNLEPAIILVDDGSGTEYSEIFRKAKEQFSCRVLTSPVNQGKGNALKKAFHYVLEQLPDSIGVVTADGDGQHAPEDIFSCMQTLAEQPEHLILGCRRFDGGEVPWKSRFGNRLTSKVLRLTRGVSISDTQTGLRAIPGIFLKQLSAVPGERYEYEMNMLVACIEHRIPMIEVPIRTIYHKGNSTSYFHPVLDSLKVYAVFLRYSLSALSSFLLDITLFTVLVFLLKGLYPAGYILLSTALARGCSSLFNYFSNKHLVFRARLAKRTAMKYYLLAALQMAASGLLVTCIYFLVSPAGETVIKILVDTGLFFLSFYIQRNWVFKKCVIS